MGMADQVEGSLCRTQVVHPQIQGGKRFHLLEGGPHGDPAGRVGERTHAARVDAVALDIPVPGRAGGQQEAGPAFGQSRRLHA